jgi:inhibitor of cysteine peptidase
MPAKIALPILSLLLLAAACSTGDDPAAGDLELGALSNGGTFEVTVANAVIVQLEGNPSTGYSWVVLDVDTSLLRQAGEYEFLTNDEAIGGAGMLQYTFEALAPGETVLRLGYLRPWETDVAPLEEWRVTITVR